MSQGRTLSGDRAHDVAPAPHPHAITGAPANPANPYATLLARAQAERRLLAVHWELTHRCNERCTHCYLTVRAPRAGRSDDLTTAECLDVLDQLAGLGVLHLTFSGGEALVRQDFFTIAAAARTRRLAVRLFSNGLAITPRIADRIAALDPLAVELSLYAADAATHDALTQRPGAWARTRQACELLHARGVRTVLKSPIMRENVTQLQALQALATELGAHFRYDLTITRGIDGTTAPLRHRLTGDELAAFVRATEPVPRPPAPGAGPQRCAVGQRALLLAPDGTVYPCPELRLPAGNVRTQPLRSIWETAPLWNELAALRTAELSACRGCAVAQRCRRCHGIALAETGTLTGAPAVACREAWARVRG